MPEKKRKTNWFWPKIVDIDTSRSAANIGFWAAIFVCVATTVITTFALGAQNGIKEILHIDEWAYLDAALFGVIAWRVKRFSRAFAVLGVALYVLEIIYALSQGAKSLGMAIPILLMFISGARGVFAYHRFVAEPNQDTQEPTNPAGVVVSSERANPAAGSAAVPISVDQRPISPQPATATGTISASPAGTGEKEIYATIADELDSGNLDRSTWTKAYAEADGDNAKARAAYIRYRAAELQQFRDISQHEVEEATATLPPQRGIFFESPTLGQRELQATLDAIQRGELAVSSIRPQDGMMPIHAVAAYGSLRGVKALLDKGSAIHQPDGRGKYPIDCARDSGHIKVAEYLQEQMWIRVLASMPGTSSGVQAMAQALLRGSEVSSSDLPKLFAFFGWKLSPNGKRAMDSGGSEIALASTDDAVRFAQQLVATRLSQRAHEISATL